MKITLIIEDTRKKARQVLYDVLLALADAPVETTSDTPLPPESVEPPTVQIDEEALRKAVDDWDDHE